MMNGQKEAKRKPYCTVQYLAMQPFMHFPSKDSSAAYVLVAGGPPIPAIAGGVCGALVLAVIVAVSVLLWRKSQEQNDER